MRSADSSTSPTHSRRFLPASYPMSADSSHRRARMASATFFSSDTRSGHGLRAPCRERPPGRRDGIAHLLAAGALKPAEQDSRVDRAAILEFVRRADRLLRQSRADTLLPKVVCTWSIARSSSRCRSSMRSAVIVAYVIFACPAFPSPAMSHHPLGLVNGSFRNRMSGATRLKTVSRPV